MGYFLFVIALFLLFLSAIYLLYLSLFYVLHQKRYASKKHAPTYEDQRFAILIPARNDAHVIEASLKALHQLDYPKNQYDIYVLINNTCDDTLERVEHFGDHAYLCQNTIRCKGDVLEEFFSKTAILESYDAFVILDADNRIDKDFLHACASSIHNGYRVAQGMKTAYNPYQSWVAGASSLYFSLANHFINIPRGTKTYSGMIFGSGFYITSDFLKKHGGWHTTSVTEDIDMTFLCLSEEETIGVMNDAITYDVQPLHFADAWKQRKRWISGDMQVRKKYQKQLWKTFCKRPSIANFDHLMLLYVGDMASIAGLLMLLLIVLLAIYAPTLLLLIFFLQWIFSILLGLYYAHKAHFAVSKMWNSFLWLWVYMLSFYIIGLLSFFHKETDWKEIKHI